jgi:carbamoyl-phosphate synthase large subunit
MRILISAAGSSAATEIIKHIRSLGHYVIGIDANEHSYALANSVCDEFYLSPLCNSIEFIPFINKLNNKFDCYIPFIDEELILLCQHAELLNSVADKLILSPKEAIVTCTSKVKFQNYCQENGLPVAPLTQHAPAIYKPDYGRGSKGIFYIEDDELIPYFSRKEGVIQKVIQGVEYTVDVLTDNESQWLFGVARKRLETAGVSRIGEIEQNKFVLSLARKCCEVFSFTGAINIQIMLDKNNIPHLIEINPRFSGSLMFSTLAGFDIIDLTLKSWAKETIKLPQLDAITNKKFIRYWQHYSC